MARATDERGSHILKMTRELRSRLSEISGGTAAPPVLGLGLATTSPRWSRSSQPESLSLGGSAPSSPSRSLGSFMPHSPGSGTGFHQQLLQTYDFVGPRMAGRAQELGGTSGAWPGRFRPATTASSYERHMAGVRKDAGAREDVFSRVPGSARSARLSSVGNTPRATNLDWRWSKTGTSHLPNSPNSQRCRELWFM